MSVAPYPEYRSSSLTPTGVAPKHWLDGVVKRGFSITLGKMVVASNENDDRPTRPYLRSANVQDGWLALDDVKEMYFSPTEAASLSLLEGDLVICEGGDVGRCALLRGNLEGYGFQNSINRARGKAGNHTAYLAYWLSHLKNNGFIDVLCNRSTIAHYTAEKLANTPMLMPTPEEQSAIAAFLDQETGKIDALVAEQERLIALLKEKRQAVISQAVTKGLNPNASMKDSGIEWLGQVPAHWEILAVWLIFELGRGRVISHEEIFSNAGDFPVYSSQTENNGEMGHIATFDFDGDYLTWTTDGANAGTVFRRSGKFNCTNVCGTMRLKSPQSDLDYLCHALSACTAAYVRQDINPKLMNNVMSKIRIPIPPADEQSEIASIVRRAITKFDTLITEATQAITLLRERRAALISAAVTGKIDVRALATSQPEAA